VLPQADAGKLIALATSELIRDPAAPKLPTISESGLPGFNTSLWFGMVAPAGTPAPIVDKLAGAINEALKNDDVVKPLRGVGLAIKGGTPDQFAAYIASETKKWSKVVIKAGLRK
jgi:tripartite-type tricarboxylate transporter receptor subunit TctC